MRGSIPPCVCYILCLLTVTVGAIRPAVVGNAIASKNSLCFHNEELVTSVLSVDNPHLDLTQGRGNQDVLQSTVLTKDSDNQSEVILFNSSRVITSISIVYDIGTKSRPVVQYSFEKPGYIGYVELLRSLSNNGMEEILELSYCSDPTRKAADDVSAVTVPVAPDGRRNRTAPCRDHGNGEAEVGSIYLQSTSTAHVAINKSISGLHASVYQTPLTKQVYSVDINSPQEFDVAVVEYSNTDLLIPQLYRRSTKHAVARSASESLYTGDGNELIRPSKITLCKFSDTQQPETPVMQQSVPAEEEECSDDCPTKDDECPTGYVQSVIHYDPVHVLNRMHLLKVNGTHGPKQTKDDASSWMDLYESETVFSWELLHAHPCPQVHRVCLQPGVLHIAKIEMDASKFHGSCGQNIDGILMYTPSGKLLTRPYQWEPISAHPIEQGKMVGVQPVLVPWEST